MRFMIIVKSCQEFEAEVQPDPDPEVMAAKKRGVLFDVGYGGLNFGFEAYENLFHQGLVTDVISSDLQGVNITGPTHSLAHVMSLFLNFGLTLKEVVERVTINPAKAQGLDDMIGSLTPGYPARWLPRHQSAHCCTQSLW